MKNIDKIKKNENMKYVFPVNKSVVEFYRWSEIESTTEAYFGFNLIHLADLIYGFFTFDAHKNRDWGRRRRTEIWWGKRTECLNENHLHISFCVYVL